MTQVIEQLSIDPLSGTSLAQQIKRQIIWLIVSGIVDPGDRLPSIRKLADHLNINLHTVRNAYALLEEDGLVETHQGWGTKVLTLDPIRITESIGHSSSGTIGVILPELFNPIYHDMLSGIQEIADLDQSMIFVCNTLEQPSLAWRYLNQLLSKGVDGIIAVSLDIESFNPNKPEKSLSQSLSVPYVSIDTPKSAGYVVNVDLEGIGYQATQHLIDHGHQRIGLITYGFESLGYRLEDHGYQQALKEAGLEIDPDLVVPVQGFEYTDGEKGAEILLSLDQPPTAIFAISDALALGAMQSIKAAGLKIPNDIALIGFNDIQAAALLDPGLTTFSLPGYEMGKQAMELLRTHINGFPITPQEITFPTPLVIRQSCGCQGEA